MRKLFYGTIFLLLSTAAAAQNPPFEAVWDNRFGGSMDESVANFLLLQDGSYVIGGTSFSGISGDKTEDNRDTTLQTSDFWLVKTDALGQKLWDKRYGGDNNEVMVELIATADGGFLMVGQSFSSVSGDKSQDNWDLTQSSNDYWVVKTDGSGNKQWDKRFGGTSFELPGSVLQTPDGGYLISGSSFSGISGDKTQVNQGSWDYWLVKLNASGVKVWDRRFGGTLDDFATASVLTADGSYLTGGYSKSNAGGDKSENCQGNWDYWIVKVNPQGNKVWDKTFGGNYTDWLFDLAATSDGGFVLGGQSFSEVSGDKSEPNHDATPAGSDFWIVRINALGVKLWDHTYGGSEIDDVSLVTELSDGGLLLSGESYSPADGNKTEPNLGVEQTWVVKTDSAGVFLWDKTIFTNGHDELGTALPSGPDCFVVVNYMAADTGGYVTETTRGLGDFWMVKMCSVPSGLYPETEVQQHLQLWPNPATNEVMAILEPGYEAVSVMVTDLTGRIMNAAFLKEGVSTHELRLQVAAWPPSMYLIEITDTRGKIYRGKFVKSE